MKIVSLKCNNCSADLKIDPKIKYFNCTYCGSSLTIKESGNVMYTEVLDEIKDNTEVLIDQSEIILLEKEIARLDREWMMKRENFKVKDRNGNDRYPSGDDTAASVLWSIIGLVLFFSIASSVLNSGSSKGSSLFAFIAVIVVFIVLGSLFSSIGNNSAYSSAKKKYETKRAQLLKELNRKKGFS